MSKSGDFHVPADIAVVIKDKDLSLRDKAVFMVLRIHATPETHSAVLPMKTIADDAGCSERCALNAINALVKRGVIERNPRFKGNRQIANFYRIVGYEAECFEKRKLDSPAKVSDTGMHEAIRDAHNDITPELSFAESISS